MSDEHNTILVTWTRQTNIVVNLVKECILSNYIVGILQYKSESCIMSKDQPSVITYNVGQYTYVVYLLFRHLRVKYNPIF